MQAGATAMIRNVLGVSTRYLSAMWMLLIMASISTEQITPSRGPAGSVRDRLYPPQIGAPAQGGSASPFAGPIDGPARLHGNSGPRQTGPNHGLTVPYWSDSFSYLGITYKYSMVGTDPKRGSATTVVPTVIIP